MFLFYHLLLSYVTADFAFQPKELINWKKKSIWGSIIHSLIFVVLAGIFCITYLKINVFWGFLLLIAIIRLVIDKTIAKITALPRIDNIFTFLAGHLIRMISLMPVVYISPLNESRHIGSTGLYTTIYNNETLMLYLSFFIIAVYGGSFVLFYLKKTFVYPGIQFNYDRAGIMERLLVFTLFLMGNMWLSLIPLIILIKAIFLFSGVKNSLIRINEPAIQFQKIRLKSGISFDLLVSPLFSILMGMVIKGL